MKKQLLGTVFGLSLALASSAANALLIVSGDSNLGNGIDGSFGATVTPGNSTFFSNVLGSGNTVKIQDENYSGSGQASTDSLNSYYNGLGGVSSSLFSGTVDGSVLSGVDVFVSILPSNSYTAGEVSAFQNFLNGGGTLFLMGENNDFFSSENSRINALLSSLGSSMSLGTSSLDGGFNTTSNIDADPLTAGVSRFTYGYTNSVISGGTSLIRTLDQTTFIAYEGVRNVPAPAAAMLIGMGLFAFGLIRRKA